jgi:ATP-binding cassette subfamily B protein
MWNRQREAEEAREKLALAGEDLSSPPAREPAEEEDALRERERVPKVEPAAAAE